MIDQNKSFRLLSTLNDLYEESFLLRMFLLGLIMFNVMMRYGIYFIDSMNNFYDYIGL
jgi:hypothetical protein